MLLSSGKIAALTLPLMVLAGCSDSALGIDSPPVSMDYSPDFDTKRVKYETSVAFRSYQPADDKSAEFAGAKCDAVTREFKASFETPAVVKLPVIKGRPSTMNVTCRSGDKTAGKIVKPGMKTAYATGSGSVGALLVANAITVGVSAAANRWQYVDDGSSVGVNFK